eukprot:snap_masked-scaffold_56-processed-gene-1.22-mRNA-1 protein AED:1.00 eAED:1.00 QI:0/-1/0/0/-1/1/1/0/272
MDLNKFYYDTIAYSKHVVEVEQKKQEMVTVLACDYFDRLCGCLGGNQEENLQEKKDFEFRWGFTVESIASKGVNVLICLYRQEMLRINEWKEITKDLENKFPLRYDFYVPKSEEDFEQEKKDEIWFEVNKLNIMRRSFNRLAKPAGEIHPNLLPKNVKPVAKINFEEFKLNGVISMNNIPILQNSYLVNQKALSEGNTTKRKMEKQVSKQGIFFQEPEFSMPLEKVKLHAISNKHCLKRKCSCIEDDETEISPVKKRLRDSARLLRSIDYIT